MLHCSWETPLVLPGAPLNDLQFTTACHGVLLRGRPALRDARLYRTLDGGVTWTPLDI